MPCHICKQRHLPFLSVDILGTAKSIAKTSKILNQKTQYITLWKRISVRVNKTKKSLFKGFTDFKSENLPPPIGLFAAACKNHVEWRLHLHPYFLLSMDTKKFRNSCVLLVWKYKTQWLYFYLEYNFQQRSAALLCVSNTAKIKPKVSITCQSQLLP